MTIYPMVPIKRTIANIMMPRMIFIDPWEEMVSSMPFLVIIPKSKKEERPVYPG